MATPANCENRMPKPTTRPSESSMSAQGSIHTMNASHGIVPGTIATRPRWTRYATIGTDMISMENGSRPNAHHAGRPQRSTSTGHAGSSLDAGADVFDIGTGSWMAVD